MRRGSLPIILIGFFIAAGPLGATRIRYSLPSREVAKQVAGKWTARLVVMVDRRPTPRPEIDDLECQIATPGLTFLLSSKGEASLLFYVERLGHPEGGYTPFNLTELELDGVRYDAEYVSPDSTPRKFSNVKYSGPFEPVQIGEGYLKLSTNDLALPADALFSSVARSDVATLTFNRSVPSTGVYQVRVRDARKLFTWCNNAFKQPIKLTP